MPPEPSNGSSPTTLHEEGQSHTKKRTPLPWMQLSIVFMIQFVEPTASAVIYPFINQFIRDTGVTKGDERNTGYFVGIIQSAFFFAEAVTVVAWGMAADRFGRRILLLGPMGLALAMMGFGMSTHFVPMVVFRWMQGAFNGNIGIGKTIIGEITDSSNIADAFAFLPVVWTSGSTIGPFIGGFLSEPAKRWPDTFGRVAYFKSYPYVLPCLVTSLLASSVFIFALIGLKETLPSSPSAGKATSSPTASLIQNNNTPHYGSSGNSHECPHPELENGVQSIPSHNNIKPPGVTYLLKLPEVQVILINFGFYGFCNTSVQALTPLMWSTTIENGGLGLSPYAIGMAMGSYGVVNAFLQAMFLGKIIRRLGPRTVYIVCFSCFFISFLSFPVANFFARRANGMDWKAWAAVVVCLVTQYLRSSANGSLSIITTGSAPSRSSLGTMNGLAQAMSCTMKSLGPSVASPLHSISLQWQLAGGNAVYYILMVIVIIGIRFAFMLPTTLRFT